MEDCTVESGQQPNLSSLSTCYEGRLYTRRQVKKAIIGVVRMMKLDQSAVVSSSPPPSSKCRLHVSKQPTTASPTSVRLSDSDVDAYVINWLRRNNSMATINEIMHVSASKAEQVCDAMTGRVHSHTRKMYTAEEVSKAVKWFASNYESMWKADNWPSDDPHHRMHIHLNGEISAWFRANPPPYIVKLGNYTIAAAWKVKNE